MIFTTKAEYGVRLLVELGRQDGGVPVSLKSIAESEGLPLAYLERIVALLKKSGFVESTRGAHGGYRLAQPAEEIRMDAVIAALEGGVSPMSCFVDDTAGAFEAIMANVEFIDLKDPQILCRRLRRAGALSGFMYPLIGLLIAPLMLTIAALIRLHPAGGFYVFGQKEINSFVGYLSTWRYFVAKLASASLMIHVVPAFSSICTALFDFKNKISRINFTP